MSIIDFISTEAELIISEGWTDGIVVSWGNSKTSSSLCRGFVSGNSVLPVTDHTVYDLASVTKLFFLIIVMKLVEEKKIDLNKCVSSYTDKYSNLQNTKIYELMNFSKELRTPKRIDEANNRIEANRIIDSIYVANPTPKYSDMGAIILSKIIDEILPTSFEEYSESLWKSLGLNETFWWYRIPEKMYSSLQCYDYEYKRDTLSKKCKRTPKGIVHDPKALLLGACGHAGIFSTPHDIAILSKRLLSGKVLSSDTLQLLLASTYDSYNNGQHYGLLCYKKAQTRKQSEIPFSCSDQSIGISGYTGVYWLLDFTNHNWCCLAANKIFHRCTSSVTISECPKLFNTSNFVYRKDSLVNLVLDCLEKLSIKQSN